MGASTPRRPPRGPRGPKGPGRPMPGGFFGGSLGGIVNAAYDKKFGKDKSSGADIFGGGMRGGPAPIKKKSEGGKKFAEFLSMMQKSKGRRGGRRRRRR